MRRLGAVPGRVLRPPLRALGRLVSSGCRSVAGIVARTRAAVAQPRGPFRARTWRSPLRGPWLTSVFGAALLVGIPLLFVTGLISYAAYNPRLPGNDTTPTRGFLGSYLFNWVTSPSWIYRVSQGIHVVVGLALVPVVLAKLWSVIPKLFEWPGIRSIAHAFERLSLVLIVGGVIFQFGTGIADIEYFYPWKFSFYDAHFYGAWIFALGFALHIALKLPTFRRSLRRRSLRRELTTPLRDTRVEEVDDPADRSLLPETPAEPTISRRGVLAVVGGTSLAVFLLTAGETVRFLRPLALLSPRARSEPTGVTAAQRAANDFEINRTFAVTGIDAATAGSAWRLELRGKRSLVLSRDQLLTLPQKSAELPISCVEGWSTVQRWTGVPLSVLAHLAGAGEETLLHVDSLEPSGQPFRSTDLAANQVWAPGALLALRVNGEDLSLDHGFPARIVVPAAPGVHCTKWVRELRFEA